MNSHRSKIQNLSDIQASQLPSLEVCKVLCRILKDGGDIHRCLAAQALGHIGSSEAVNPLIAALLDEDEDVRTDAAAALSELGSDQAGPQLMENLLGDPCTDVKLSAIDALARMQDKQVIPWLRRMLKGRDEEIIWDDQEFYSSGWDDWIDIQVKSISALAALNAEEAVPDIIAAIKDENAQDMTEIAFKAFAQMGKPGIEALDQFLDDKQTRLRRRAATVLASIETEEASTTLTRAFSDPSSEVRMATLQERSKLAPPDPRLAIMFKDSDPSIRAEAARLLGQNYPDHVRNLLDDDTVSVQVAALGALVETNETPVDQDLIAELQQKLKAGSSAISTAAASALAVISPQTALEDLVGFLDDTGRSVEARLGVLQALVRIGGDQAVEALASRIDDEARLIRLEAMSGLATLARCEGDRPETIGSPAAVKALLFALQGGYEPEVEEHAAAIAEEKKDPVMSKPVVETVAKKEVHEEDDDVFPMSTMDSILKETPLDRETLKLPAQGIELTPSDMERLALAKNIKGKKRMSLAPKIILHEDIRRFAARVLGDIPHEDVAGELAIALRSGDGEVRMAAADSLARIGMHVTPLPASVAEPLKQAMEGAEREEKIRLIRALAACEGAEIGELLTALLDDEDCFIRSEAISALSRSGNVGSEIEALLEDVDPAVRLSAAKAVASGGNPDAVNMLVGFSFTHEGYHGRQTARLLRKLDIPKSSALFVDVLQDAERKRIWPVAIEALKEINQSLPVLMTPAIDNEQHG